MDDGDQAARGRMFPRVTADLTRDLSRNSVELQGCSSCPADADHLLTKKSA